MEKPKRKRGRPRRLSPLPPPAALDLERGQTAYKAWERENASLNQRLVERILTRPDAEACFESKKSMGAAFRWAIREEAKTGVDERLPPRLKARAKDLEKTRRKTIRQTRERRHRAARSAYEKAFRLCHLPKKRPAP